MGTEKDIRFGEWLRRELEKRGYEFEGPRAGGKARFAQRAGISASIVSRILSEDRVPEIETLRKIGQVLGYNLGEMLVFAGLAEPEEVLDSAPEDRRPRLEAISGGRKDPEEYGEPDFFADIAAGVTPPYPPFGLRAGDNSEATIWAMEDLPPEVRWAAIRGKRSAQDAAYGHPRTRYRETDLPREGNGR